MSISTWETELDNLAALNLNLSTLKLRKIGSNPHFQIMVRNSACLKGLELWTFYIQFMP